MSAWFTSSDMCAKHVQLLQEWVTSMKEDKENTMTNKNVNIPDFSNGTFSTQCHDTDSRAIF